MTVEIICADSREALARFPDGHFHCCVTSPPFWGLRDYGLEPMVWGPDCEHEWGESLRGVGRDNRNGLTGSLGDDSPRYTENLRGQPVAGAFCRRCNAWRGTLGLEPTPELYVEHLVSVMREVRRVLRDDGTLWLNLGDSYAGSWGAQSRPNGNDIGSTLQGGSMLSARQIEAHPRGQTHTGSIKDTPGLKPKDLVGIPWMVAFALRADGWWLRSDIVWSKPNPMPESVRDRPTRSHEYLFLLTKRERYYYDQGAIREPSIGQNEHDLTGPGYAAPGQTPQTGSRKSKMPDGWATHEGDHGSIHRDGREAGAPSVIRAGRNRRSVWEIPTQPFPGAHFAVFPEKLVEPCILAGCPEGGTVLDPFSGSGTVGLVAERLGRHSVLIDAKPEYCEMARARTAQMGLMGVAAS